MTAGALPVASIIRRMADLRPAPGSTILFEGDSLTGFRLRPGLDTWAWQRMTGAAYGYPERVGDWIFCHRPDLRLSVRLGAVGGSIMADVLARWNITEELRPAIVVMTVGSNDGNRAVEPGALGRQMAEYCRRLDALCGGRVLYLAHPKPDPEHPAKAHYAAAAEAVRAAGGQVVQLGPVLAARERALQAQYAGHTLYHDGNHFNAVGNEVVAGVVLQALGLMARPGAPD